MFFSIVESCDGNGLEAWRILSKKYTPTTHARCVQLMAAIISSKIGKSEEVLGAIVRWGAMVSTPSKDHQEHLSEKLKLAFLLKTPRQQLYDKVVEKLGRLTSYQDVHDKIASLVQSEADFLTGDEMGAVVKLNIMKEILKIFLLMPFLVIIAARCGGCGRYPFFLRYTAREGQGEKWRAPVRSLAPCPWGTAPIKRTHCKRTGRLVDRCYTIHPELRGKGNRRVNELDKAGNAGEEDEVDCGGIVIDIGAVSANIPYESCAQHVRMEVADLEKALAARRTM